MQRLSQFEQMPKEYSLPHSQKELKRDRNVSVELGFLARLQEDNEEKPHALPQMCRGAVFHS